MKSRGVYETPGGSILYKAHNVLETITLDKESFHFKDIIAQKMGEIVYNGQWYTPLREAICAFTDELQKDRHRRRDPQAVQGQHDQRRRHQPLHPVRRADCLLREDDDYDQADSAGFINLFGLPIAERAKLAKKWPKE